MFWLAIHKLYRRTRLDVVNPEDYAAAGGEVLVMALIVSWVLTFALNRDAILHNRLNDAVGYPNLCVGWDEPPAQWVAAPMFAMIIVFFNRYMELDLLRQNLTREVYKGRIWTYCANRLCMASWAVGCLIFVIPPRNHPNLHSAAFIQLMVCMYFAYVANFLEAEPKYWPRYWQFYVAVYSFSTFGFAFMAAFQLHAYDSETGKRGPIPWFVVAVADYSWFLCLTVGYHFRPAAPSVAITYELVSDSDFEVVDGMQKTEEEMHHRGADEAVSI